MGPIPYFESFVGQSFFWGWTALLAAPLVVGWRAARRTGDVPRWELALLVAVTASYAWLLLGGPFPALLGPSYEPPRYAILIANQSAMVVLGGWAAAKARTLELAVAPPRRSSRASGSSRWSRIR